MKRHFSNRGEALSEVAAAHGRASRRLSIAKAFMIQADRRTRPSIWLRPQSGTTGSVKRKQAPSFKEIGIVL